MTRKFKILRPEEVTEFPTNFGELTPEELAEVYKLGREAFTAADLQKYTELDEGIPLEEVIREMAKNQEEFEKDDNDQSGERPANQV